MSRTFTYLGLRGVRNRLSAKVEVARIRAEIKATDSEVVRCLRRELSRLKGAAAALKRQLEARLLNRASSVELSSASADKPKAAYLPKEMH